MKRRKPDLLMKEVGAPERWCPVVSGHDDSTEEHSTPVGRTEASPSLLPPIRDVVDYAHGLIVPQTEWSAGGPACVSVDQLGPKGQEVSACPLDVLFGQQG